MTRSNRRIFMMTIAVAGSGLAATAQAQLAMVDPKEAQASALGYVDDTTKADKAKFPKHAADQKCGSCQLYTGKAGEKSGPCTLFPNKAVSAEGWCSAWVKKAG